MTRPTPAWERSGFCHHPSYDTRIAGPRDCSWCGKPNAWGLIGRATIPQLPFDSAPWWRSLLSRAYANSFRFGPGLVNWVRAAVNRWIAHEVIPWLVERADSLLQSVWSCIGFRLR